MHSIKIWLRTVLTVNTLKRNIRRTLNKIVVFQYISIQTKFMVDGNAAPTLTLGKNIKLIYKIHKFI